MLLTEKNLPYVSVIIPVLDGEKYIYKCLDSITELNYPKDLFEIIIVDNGSSDKTIDIVKSFQNCKLYFEKRKSSYIARNLGIKNAKGDIIAFTDIDCIVDKDWLINIVQYFSDTTVGGVAGDILPESKDSLIERYSINEEILSQKRTFNSSFLPYAQTANAAYRKELFERIGYFDEVISGGDADYSWRMQLETDYKMVFAQDAVVLHKHRTNLKGLFKQRLKHGFGSVLVREKYKNFFNRKNTSLKLYQRNNSGSVMASIKNALVQKDFMLILPILVNMCGFNLGKMYARLLIYKNNRIGNGNERGYERTKIPKN